MIPQKDNNLILCNKDYGPTFGGGSDIYIKNRESASASFPYTYNYPEKPYKRKSQESKTAFSGATKDQYFKV